MKYAIEGFGVVANFVTKASENNPMKSLIFKVCRKKKTSFTEEWFICYDVKLVLEKYQPNQFSQ